MIDKIEVSIYNSMQFQRGKSYCVEAASGIGKSSLLHFIGGFRNEYQGTILIDGKNVKNFSLDQKSSLYRQELAYVFQDLCLFPDLTAYENAQIINQQTHFRAKEYIDSLFEQLQISDKKETKVRFLSIGQQQRVAFIRALCQPCSFILLDEPISHLDEKNAQIMAQILMQEQQERQFGIIVTSLGNTLPIKYDQIIRL